MTERTERLNAFVLGDLKDAEKALELALASDELVGKTGVGHALVNVQRAILLQETLTKASAA